ncbi:putative minor extracellular protease vpr protein [Phaeoacremonium minimum UCRPA7]|uniref:Putative minor extracellular protease vpr protein n=1 Tax=Phaeoacremonium minimum (strain UCR-PA7) TaxID=1286976 RepID=R8BPB5_PHAM7|nr:putative minor extracellular protease vpr protein [Phaeoacremonium minimum UCRPA7]EOO01181.1 putative minor extracellular protease vpr protein [Phaeoacremonium minimum UCRPA7]
MTGVDKLHAAGILGKGAKVAIVDTGVYYTHPALGGGIGPGFKIAGGYDLVGDGIWPEAGEKEPDTDPMDQQGHGTHVSGIIAGKSDIFTGVAPEATLFMYKVFSQIDGTDEDTLIDAFLMAYKEGSEAGAAIINTIKAGGNVTADFTEAPIKHIVGVPNDEDGRAPSTFTSIGATNELFIKPDVAAPGGRILSTYLNNGYAILSGTSMACPYVAGVAALYIGKYGGRAVHGPKFAKSLAMRLISSGEAVRWDDGTGEGNDFGFLASVAQVGTGIVNASKVLDYTTSLSFAKFALNDTHHFSRYQSVDIENVGAAPVTYTFSSQAFGGMETVLTDTAYWGVPRIAWFEEVMAAPKTMVPAISYPGGTFTVKPGETKTAKFSFKYPEGLTPANLPLYSGKVIISGSNGETLSVPYMGLAADLHKDIGIMFQSPIGFPTLTSLRSSVPISQKSNFTFDLATDIQDFPKLYTRMNYATTMLRWDIFNSGWTERDWKYPPAVGVAGYVGSVTSWAQASGKSFFNASSDDINDLISLPITDLPRDIAGVYGVELWWLGRLANGTQIAPGRYNMRFAALVPFGNPTASDNWDIFETPEFDVLPL